MNTELITTSNAAVAHRQATDVAGVIRQFALTQCVEIQGKRYPKVEAWQAIANSYGCVASAKEVEVVEGGIRAIGEVRRIHDGIVIASGEGFVGDDEPLWEARKKFARRAMAQTRSISRACRAAFAFVIPLIDANLGTTPAEEMEAVHESKPAPPMRRLSIATETELGGMKFTDRLMDVKEKEGSSAKGPWRAFFLHFENREEEPGTFDTNLGGVAQSLVGAQCDVKVRPGRKQGTLELVSIEPADDIPT